MAGHLAQRGILAEPIGPTAGWSVFHTLRIRSGSVFDGRSVGLQPVGTGRANARAHPFGVSDGGRRNGDAQPRPGVGQGSDRRCDSPRPRRHGVDAGHGAATPTSTATRASMPSSGSRAPGVTLAGARSRKRGSATGSSSSPTSKRTPTTSLPSSQPRSASGTSHRRLLGGLVASNSTMSSSLVRSTLTTSRASKLGSPGQALT